MTYDDITRREAKKLIALGMYETIAEAWEEAEAICKETDAYEAVEEYNRLQEEDDDDYNDYNEHGYDKD